MTSDQHFQLDPLVNKASGQLFQGAHILYHSTAEPSVLQRSIPIPVPVLRVLVALSIIAHTTLLPGNGNCLKRAQGPGAHPLLGTQLHPLLTQALELNQAPSAKVQMCSIYQ
jgi:hypothetical protein